MTTRHQQNVANLILAQHKRMNELVEEILSSAITENTAAFQELVRLLAVHEATEEELVQHTVTR
ncbi:hypothetical protein ACFQZZ_25790 [Nocardia sp. GCM10030253]|uniref:hypothetical protein n=1 Tax=Nocardia sp. GCM10030253 TaxID=3273404 RepID=UPI00363D8157